MRAYWAVIQDSFREALASRVLWVLLVLITLLLALLAPVGYRQQVTSGLSEGSVRNLPQFIEHVRDQARQDEPSPAKRIVALLDEPLRSDVLAFKMPGKGEMGGALKMLRVMDSFCEALNRILARRDFYDANAWGKTRLVSDEARELAKKQVAAMSEAEVGRWNRLVLEAAFPDFIPASPPTSLRFRYLGYDLGEPLPFRQSQFESLLESIVERVTRWLVGTLGVFVAILVTAAIIPQTFDPGSLALLLSKPVRRSLLFLAKFCGGCMFILLNASYLVLGLWLILALRFGLWDARILLCIPVYVFMFAIYYTVSALAGVLWRNAIASVIVSILFWLVCFVVGAGKAGVEQLVLNKTRITELVVAKDTLLSVNEMGLTNRWDDKQGKWVDAFRAENEEAMQRRVALTIIPHVPSELRPLNLVYDASGDRLITATRSLRSGQMVMSIGPRAKDWAADSGVGTPLGTMSLLREADGRILAVSTFGLYRLAGDPNASAPSMKVFGFSLPLPARDPFAVVGPEPPLGMFSPAAAAINQDTGELAAYSRGTVTLLRAGAADRYERRLEKRLKGDSAGAVVLAYGGDTLLVGREDGRLVAYDTATLAPRREFSVEGKNQPRFVTVAPGGRWFAVVFHHGALWIYDRNTNEMFRPRIAGQRDVSCCLFPAPNRILVADRATRLTEYELPSWQVSRRHSPPLSVIETGYRYILSPLYTVFPKPGELDKTVQYLLSGKETKSTDHGGDLAAAQQELHPWRPVWSSLAFMAVMLTLGCIYLERQDF
jgi:hypothetical protein